MVDARWPERVAGRAEALQELLGEYQDRVVARAWLEDIAPDRPDLAFLAGDLAARCSFEQDELRARARAAWKVARKSGWRGRNWAGTSISIDWPSSSSR